MKEARRGNTLFLFVLTFYMAAGILLRQFGVLEQLPDWMGLVMGEILMLVPTVLYLLVTRTNPFAFFPKKGIGFGTVCLIVLFSYCMLPLISCINALSMLVQKSAVSGVMVTLTDYPLWAAVLMIAVLPALCEEFLFRGVLYHTYRRQRIWPAIFLSALFFGLMHLNFNQFCYATAMGIMAALLVEATGSLWAPVVMHFTYNANSTVLSWLLLSGSGEMMPEADASQDLMGILQESLGEEFVWGDPEMMMGLIIGLGGAALAMLALAAVGTFLGWLLYRGIAKHCGRKEHVRVLFSKLERQAIDDQREPAPTAVFSWEAAAAILLAVAYIVYTW